ncbi:hypothetical protein SAMN05216249_11314 [Acetitomaculum ruminis DSM 5522]|uniref:Uncharacterized protein n=1 Tax=Acetitomaculum ruminis DSM 5522 TaxID=1120918 RepID=A0A1I0Z559_9FIRM|nr:hypothetical protein [Acetitomaculum ruminis]SFB20477.1 hypothetical protein SAMN05216249_11314 [Acetitomaculum ruminis DSM 5522]
MFVKPDNTYNDIRYRSLNKWLDDMEEHEDIAVRCGVPLARDYVKYLKDEIKRLNEENQLKNTHMKKLIEKYRTK